MSGRIKAISMEMRRFAGSNGALEDKAYEQQVAAVLRGVPGARVKTRVTHIGSVEIAGPQGPLGDIDVLAAFPSHNVIILVEANNFNGARTPAELKNEIDSLFKGEKSTVSKHSRRVAWIKKNLPIVLSWLGDGGLNGADSWQVSGVVVSSTQLLSPLVHTAAMRVSTFQEVVDDYEAALGL
jgi:hypothetical protein